MEEPWNRSGFLRAEGFPSPTGDHPVGCVDLMHQFKGDEHGGLLVRLFYPALLNQNQHLDQPTTYTTWFPNKLYLKAYLDFKKVSGSGIISSITNTLINPRIPAVFGAALLGSYLQPNSTANGSETGAETGATSSETGAHGSETGAHGSETGASGSEPAEDGTIRSRPPFPVVVFSHGLGGMRTTYSSICYDIASHGYLVASVEHRDRSACTCLQRVPGSSTTPEAKPTFADKFIDFYHITEQEKEFPLRNKQVLQRSRDAILALELLTMLNEGVEVDNMMETDFDFTQFKGRLDLRKAAIMGHSFGGATTIQALSQDDRFQCGIALDCWMLPIHRDLLEAGVRQPLLFINSYAFQWPENVKKMMKLTHPPEHTGASACTILTLKGSVHTSQTDVPFVKPRIARRFSHTEGLIDPVLTHKLNMEICHSFLKRYLLRDSLYCEKQVANLDGCQGHSENIIFGTNVDTSSVPSNNGVSNQETGHTQQEDSSKGETQENEREEQPAKL